MVRGTWVEDPDAKTMRSLDFETLGILCSISDPTTGKINNVALDSLVSPLGSSSEVSESFPLSAVAKTLSVPPIYFFS